MGLAYMKAIKINEVPELEMPRENMTKEAMRWWKRRHQFFLVLDKQETIVFASCSYSKARMAQVTREGLHLVRCQMRNFRLYFEAMLVDQLDEEMKHGN